MPYDLEKFGYLWDGSSPGWVLLESPELLGGYCIFNEINSVLLHVDDERLNLLLCERMKSLGCRAIKAMQKGPPLKVERRS